MTSEGSAESALKSVKTAFRILTVVAQNGGPITLKKVGQLANIAPSKAHRYLQSLCSCGLLSQAGKSGAYDLGVESMRLGLAAVNRIDIINRTGDSLAALVQGIDADAFLTVWSESGPTIVRFERSQRLATTMIGAGVSIPVLTSATGHVFLAFGDRERAQAIIKREAGDRWQETLASLEPKLEETREAGFGYSLGAILPGRHCIAAPIITIDDHVLAVVAVVSMDDRLTDKDGPYVTKLTEFCRRHSLSKRGYLEESPIEQKIAM